MVNKRKLPGKFKPNGNWKENRFSKKLLGKWKLKEK